MVGAYRRQCLKIREADAADEDMVEGKTEHAWFMNRRVEFVVTRNREVKVHPETGEPPQLPAADRRSQTAHESRSGVRT